MITESVSNWFLGVVALVIGWIPDLPGESAEAVEGFSGNLADIVALCTNLSPIIPFEDIGRAAVILGIFTAFAFVFQVSRIAISVVTLGGGGV